MPAPSNQPDAADLDFACYCREHDIDALARVFDATAPRLALVAAHLVGAAAEDLVQTTFLEAMRCADRFEVGRPVLPWLLAILTRRAANLRRSTTRATRHRDPGVELDSLADGEPGPAELAAERESVARISSAIDQLDGGTREACALRMLHGLRPVEIARALGRPLGTVHSQLHRGARELRRVLPHALAVTVATLLGRDALAAVRIAVLDAARGGTTAAAALVVAGLGVKPWIAVLAAALAALAITLVTWPLDDAREQAPAPRAASVPRLVSLGAPDTARDDTPANREVLEPALHPGSPSDITMSGRVVRDEDGEPIAGVTVTLRAWSREVWAKVAENRTAPSPVTTDAEGRFRITCAHDVRVSFELGFDAEDRVASVSSGDWEGLRPGAVLELGDLPLAPACIVRLRILDEDGAPVPGYRLQLHESRPRRVHDDRTLRASLFGMQSTDAEGWYPTDRLPPGRWRLMPEGNGSLGYVDLSPESFEIAIGDLPRVIELRAVRPAADVAIAGVIVDTNGARVAFAEMQWTHHGADGEAVRDGRSRHDGSFEFCVHHATDRATLARVGRGLWLFGREYELVAPLEPLAAGTKDLRVVVRRVGVGDVTLRVTDETGRPIEDFRASLLPVHHDAKHAQTWFFERDDGLHGLQLETDQEHQDGVRSWRERSAGDWLMFVEPSDPARARVFAREIRVVTGQEQRVELRLPPRGRLHVRVVRGDGTPVGGSLVELIRVPGRTPEPPIHSAGSLHDVFDVGISGTFVPVVTATATTDPDGHATLDDAPDDGVAALRVRGATHRTCVVRLTQPFDRGHLHELRVESAAEIRGTLAPLEVVQRLGPTGEQRRRASQFVDGDERLEEDRPRLTLLRTSDHREVAECRVGDDGTFRFGGLPPGDYVLQLTNGFGNDDAMVESIAALRAGETRGVTCDVADWLPARLRLRVLFEGRPSPPARLSLSRCGAQVSREIDDRALVIERVFPGEWIAQLDLEKDGPNGRSIRL
ncbi:MAG: sigma-70 family RNA polymerase sigma factor, partial [Planctomycetes bacterium]|nr:sigma-70 family RNA polymerase sigma factor [Planctomycetota bacterium]